MPTLMSSPNGICRRAFGPCGACRYEYDLEGSSTFVELDRGVVVFADLALQTLCWCMPLVLP